MYTNAKYMNDMAGNPSSIRVDINGVTSFVPLDPANTDYQNIMRLLLEDKITIEPAE